jgi:6-pyruvoyltetrahydropterin/6-carboxytetrahydropterin synthase
MIRLTREVRFAVNAAADEQGRREPSNTYGGYPSLTGLGHYFALQLTLAGRLDPASGYLQNIKRIDQLTREVAAPVVDVAVRSGRFGGGGRLLARLFDSLRDPWPGLTLEALRLRLSPLLSLGVFRREFPMVRLSQKFEFCASHRLFNPAYSEQRNLEVFGKCSYPHGHGHNYELEVTLAGEPDADGVVMEIPALERMVTETVVERFDHRNLNVDVAEFAALNPTVENIAAVIYNLLKQRFVAHRIKLASVRVWETARTWCEYSEE